jgi:hypothetical protein
LKALVEEYNKDGTVATDELETLMLDKSSSYKKLIRSLKQSAQIVDYASDGTSIKCQVSFIGYENACNLMASDKSGFVHDIRNLKSLDMSMEDLQEYAYDYLYLLIDKCNTATYEVTLSLTQCTNAPFEFSSNKPIIEIIETEVDKIVYDSIQMALEVSDDEETSNNKIEYRKMEVGKSYLLNYAVDDKTTVPVILTIKSLQTGEDAVNAINDLSITNSSLISSNVCYLEYEVYNCSNQDIIFSDKFYDADISLCNLFIDDTKYVGLNKTCNINAGSTTMINSISKMNHDGLVWYDSQASELYLLNYK